MATSRKLDFPDVTDPNFDPDVPFEADNGLNYKWNGNAWEVVCGAGTGDDGFLLKHGHEVDDAPDTVVYKWNQNVDVILDDNLDWTFKNEDDFLRLDGSDGDEINIYGELQDVEINASHIYMDAGYDARLTSTYRDVTLEATDGAEKVNRTIDNSSPDEQIANKRYVDETAAFLQGEVIELEEEIEAIAISYERGEWISATDANAGNFNMRSVTAGGITQDYTDETIFTIFFSNFDAQVPSVEHGWADVQVGMILELLDKPDSDYAIFEITGKTVSASSVGFDVAYIKGVGEATLGDRARIKIFAKPTGGSLEDYVRIAGDTMTGALKIEKPQPSPNNEVSFQIKGKIKQADGSLADGILFKDYRRAVGSSSSDYVAYYGASGGSKEIINREAMEEYALHKYGDDVTASANVDFKWNKKVTIESDDILDLKSGGQLSLFPNSSTGKVSIRSASQQDVLFDVQRNAKPQFRVFGNSKVQAGETAELAFMATEDHDLTTKKFVDGRIAELLARIEELEMAGDAPTNYRLEFTTRGPFSGGAPGPAMDPGQIFAQSKLYSNNDGWYVTQGNETEPIGGENGWVFVCFDSDDWVMHSTGTLHTVQKNTSGSTQTFTRDSKVFRLVVSNAEKCPDQYSSGKNIWRFETVPVLYKQKDYENNYLSSYSSADQIYITFANGSLSIA